VGKDTTKYKVLLQLEGNIDHLLRLEKLEHPFKSRIRHQNQFEDEPERLTFNRVAQKLPRYLDIQIIFR
jgi:hypothetical protein